MLLGLNDRFQHGFTKYMNRLEFLLIALAIFVGCIYFIRSKKFDAFVDKLLHGSKTKTASELETDIKRVEKTKAEIHNELLEEEERIISERKKLKKL